MVEIAGGGGFVEQQAASDDGNAVSPCSNSTSSQLVLRRQLHPQRQHRGPGHHQPVPRRRDPQLHVREQRRHPAAAALQGLPVRGHSIIVVSQDKLAKDEAVLAVTITRQPGPRGRRAGAALPGRAIRVHPDRSGRRRCRRSGGSPTVKQARTSRSSATASTTRPTRTSRSPRTSGVSRTIPSSSACGPTPCPRAT